MSDRAAAKSLLSAAAVRDRAQRMLALEDRLPNFQVHLDRLDSTAQLVIDITRTAYPTLDIPFHSRWRHFEIDGIDRWHVLDRSAGWTSPDARARAAFDLAIVSVLLDAGAGTQWRFNDPHTGQNVGRSEGLALTAFEMFRQGIFSSRPNDPYRVDADALAALTDADLAAEFQVSERNPLPGLSGRADLLRRLGNTVLRLPEVFGQDDTPRPGGLFDHLSLLANSDQIGAAAILEELLTHLAPIWPSRLTLGGLALGDCWRHSALKTGDAVSDLVPLHKLSQWLAYSLIEPLQMADIEVTDIDGLTGLAEYRNGGLFIDAGVLTLRDGAATQRTHAVDSELIVEWRALTVALLDRIAETIRQKLHMDRQTLPLARVLQGGTWAAGRILARQLRTNGEPPLRVASDGTVF